MGASEHRSLLVGCEVSTFVCFAGAGLSSVCYTISQQLQDVNQANLRP